MEPISIAVIAAVFAYACTPGKTSTASVEIDATSVDAKHVDDIGSSDVSSITPDADVPTSQDSYSEVTPTVPQCPSFPLNGAQSLFAESPCGKDSFINDIDDNGWGSCTNMGDKSYLFHVGATGIDQFHQTAGVPDQVVTGTKLFYSGQLQDQWGFGAWDINGTKADQWTGLPTLSPGMPSFAKGIDIVGGKLFVASSNVSFATGSADYKPGTIFAFDATLNSVATITTTQVNPTSVGQFEQGGVTYLAVVSSGPLNDKDAKSQLDIIDPSTLTITKSIQLPFGGIGINGEIAITGGRMAMGSADNSGRVIVLNTQDLNATPLILTVTEAFGKSGLHFISMTHFTPDGKHLVAGNYNTGKMSVWELGDASSDIVKQTLILDDNLMDASGIGDAACINGKLMVSVGNKIMAVQ